MNTIRLANSEITLRLDIADWMRSTGRFDGIRDTGRDWIQATCVFHDDRTPSFAVNADHGNYVCSACGAKGTFVSLVKHVENHATAYDAELSLIARFGSYVPATNEPLNLDFGDVEEETFVTAMPDDWALHSTWLEDQRGISAATQERFNVGYAAMRDAVAIPWADEKGRVVTIKYRRAGDKQFWYEPRVTDGRLKRALFGLHIAKDAKMIVVCEGEIDAMSVVQSGFAAVALGGSSLSKEQATLLRNHACDEVVVFTDNDEAGRKARAAIVDALVGSKRVSVVDWSMVAHNPAKDANDVLRGAGQAFIARMIENRIPVGLSLNFE